MRYQWKALLTAITFLTLASCYYGKPVYIPDRTGRAAAPCREIGRVKCALEECKGTNMDYVTYQCVGEAAQSRCVANFRCKSD
jgi:hypothetical protein